MYVYHYDVSIVYWQNLIILYRARDYYVLNYYYELAIKIYFLWNILTKEIMHGSYRVAASIMHIIKLEDLIIIDLIPYAVVAY